MRKTFRSAFLLTAAMGAALYGQEKTTPAAPLQNKTKQAQLIARLEQRIPQLMKDGGVPGLSIALVRNGELAWQRGFGIKSAKTKEPVDDDTVFEAASLSKPVFAYAVLKLVDAGKIDLDKPLNQYLPGNYDVGDDPRLREITARRVLSHTTGFPNWRNGPLKIYLAPGTRFSYSGEGFVYLSRVIEHVTGEKFNDFMTRMVFEPLDMPSSSYVWREDYDARKVFRHNARGEAVSQNKQFAGTANAAASLHTTARDYGRFVAAILKGTGLKPETRKLMLTPQTQVMAGGPISLYRPNPQPLPDVAWGLGWGLQTTRDGLSFCHWGDNGDSKAYVVAFEKEKLGVAFFANSFTGLSIAREIIAEAVGGQQPALDWLNYEPYKPTGRTLFKAAPATGAATALEDVEFTSNGDRLSGSIVFPVGQPIHSAVVFVHGSGKQTRGMAWAERFAKDGIAALVYDKRGAGKSGGRYESEQSVSEKNLVLLADDAMAALTALAAHPALKGVPLGLTGISQAGWIVPLAAEKTKLAKFIVLWSGPVCKVSEEDIFSKYTADSDGKEVPSYEEALNSRKEKYIWPDFLGKDIDPSESLAKLEIPGLWIFGGNDGSVPVDLSMQRLRRLRKSGQPFDYVMFSSLGHNNMPETFATAIDWIKRRVK